MTEDPARSQRRRDLVVIGASAGGVEAVQSVVGALPSDLPAAVLVVIHISPEHRSVLAELLDKRGPLPATQARDREHLAAGHIYVAPPGRHLVVMDSEMRLLRTATENLHRPSIDPLFRSAAAAFGPRVIGVVLSGTLDDGTAGLKAIKAAGGVTIAQDPADAAFPGMPESAIANVGVDHVAPARDLGGLIARLAGEEVIAMGENRGERPLGEDEELHAEEAVHGGASSYSCPDCGGVLTELEEDGLLHFRCRTGHAYSPETLVSSQTGTVEDALWVALRAMEENAEVCSRLAARSSARGRDALVLRYEKKAESMMTAIDTIRALLFDGPDFHAAEQRTTP